MKRWTSLPFLAMPVGVALVMGPSIPMAIGFAAACLYEGWRLLLEDRIAGRAFGHEVSGTVQALQIRLAEAETRRQREREDMLKLVHGLESSVVQLQNKAQYEKLTSQGLSSLGHR